VSIYDPLSTVADTNFSMLH